jgi:hypothetical protein
MMTILKNSAANAETARTTITAPLSNEEFCDQRRWKWKPTDDAGRRAKKPTTFTMDVSDPNC